MTNQMESSPQELSNEESERSVRPAENAAQPHLFSEKEVERKEKLLQQSIQDKYEAIKNMENELKGMQFQVKQSTAPKKKALELLRVKIEEASIEVKDQRAIAQAKAKELEYEVNLLKEKELAKERLCDELAMLVHQNVQMRYEKLETLTLRLQGMEIEINKGGQGGMSEAIQQQIRNADAEVSGEVHVDVENRGGKSLPSFADHIEVPLESPESKKAYRVDAAAAKAAHVALPAALKRPPRGQGKSSRNSPSSASEGSNKASVAPLPIKEAHRSLYLGKNTDSGKFQGFDCP